MDFNLSELWITTYRALISLLALFLITKLIGKKQVSQLTLFDYVIGISIGNFAAEMTINLEASEVNGIWAVVIFGIVAYLVSIITMKSMTIRKFFAGTPTILIQDGEILKEGLKKVRFDMNDLLEVCRCKGYFDISKIKYALMEANGEVSILPKSENKPVETGDLNIEVEEEGLVANIIIDGNIMEDNLIKMNKNIKWLNKMLKKNNIKLEEVLLGTLDINGNLKFYDQKVDKQVKNVLE